VKDDAAYLLHIREAIERILEYAAPGKEAFLRSHQIQDAIIRNLQVLGEAAKKVSPEFRAAHAEVPWKEMAGMRDRVIHGYFGVSLEIVWDVVENHLPPLRGRIGALLPESGRSTS
jgi:uncharacterized protein with HEPN domain